MSDRKFGEKDSVAYCQPTIIWISPNLGIWPFGEWSLNPSWPPPILRKIWTNKVWGFGGLSRDLEKSVHWDSIKINVLVPKTSMNLKVICLKNSAIGFYDGVTQTLILPRIKV